MGDERNDTHTLLWRVSHLEEELRDLRADMREQLTQHRTVTDAVIHQVREQLHEDYLTQAGARNEFITRGEVSHRDDLRRQWPITLATGAAATAAIVQAITLIFLK